MSDENGENGKNGEFDALTFLYIRTHPADDGSIPLASGLPFWASPDIAIIRPGGIWGTEAYAGEADQIEVIVSNAGGIDATDAYVDVFVADPSTAFTPLTAQPIGGGFLSIPNHNTATITIPWTPTSADEGHRCLLARVCLSFPPDCYANPAIFDVVGDRHVAQRNINVVKIEKDLLTFGFFVVNPLPQEAAEFFLEVAEVHREENAEAIRGTLNCPYAQFSEAPLAGVGLALGEEVPPPGMRDERGRRITLCTGPLREPEPLTEHAHLHLEMRPDQRRYATITVGRNPDIRPGDLNVVQVRQVDTSTKSTVGGLWLVVQH
jgi:hypothetical protein